MKKEISTQIFLEAIQDAGAFVVKSEYDQIGDDYFEDYMHSNAPFRVTILVSDEVIPTPTALSYLQQLNLIHLISQGLFNT